MQISLRRAWSFAREAKMEEIIGGRNQEDIDLEDVFQEGDSTHVYVNPDPDAAKPNERFDYADSIVSSLEADFKNMPDIAGERRKHKENLTKKLADLTKKLKTTKNIKNHRMRAQNALIAEKRKKLRAQIETVKDDLYAIELEEKGGEVSSTSLVDATVQGVDETPDPVVTRPKPVPDPSNPGSYITASNSSLFDAAGRWGIFSPGGPKDFQIL
jgi:hypothetical protein